MKLHQLVLVFLLCCTAFISHAQTNQWTWVSGDSVSTTSSNYGTKGVAASSNHPGPRSESTSCTDNAGNLWLFGGKGKDVNGQLGILNDLWKWDGTNWTWMAGSNLANQAGSFGTQGVANASNTPPSRTAGICGFDKNGNLWLFGGSYEGKVASNYTLNDLWKWDGSNWTWVKGSNKVNGLNTDYWGIYGTKNIAASTNTPGGRSNAVGWTDSTGNLWLFGGMGYSDSSFKFSRRSFLNDTWKWDGSNWTWVKGYYGLDSSGIFGTKNQPNAQNNPGGRFDATIMKSKNGIVWLFGGRTFFSSKTSDHSCSNDLWKWDGSNWTWVSGSNTGDVDPVFGQMGIPNASNMPDASSGYMGWADSANNLYLFGGMARISSVFPDGPLWNVLWKWDGTNWTWLRGDTSYNSFGNYGTKTIASSNNSPASRNNGISWVDNKGKLFLFGGWGIYYSAIVVRSLNDTWYWDGSNWVWHSGAESRNITESLGIKGIASNTNQPGERSDGISWRDLNGNLWMFGGRKMHFLPPTSIIYPPPYLLNDLWKWNGSNWTWMGGSNAVNQLGNFGIKGVTAPSNYPSARASALSWLDNNGMLWMFGGVGIDNLTTTNGFQTTMNDMWKWDGTNWTFAHYNVSPKSINGYVLGNYGQKNLTTSSNIPPAIALAATWTDKSGNCWLYGGTPYNQVANNNFTYNHLWKWDGTNWTWVKGDSTLANHPPVYGTKGIADSANTPGNRANATTWKDSNDNMYLFGGVANFVFVGDGLNFETNAYNDLWKWDGTNWTWLSGSNITNPKSGNYGKKGVPASSNQPPERTGARGWTDKNGNLWLFGGTQVSSSQDSFNELWVWDGKYWTWISGDSSIKNTGIYRSKGVGDINTKPGGRSLQLIWNDPSSNSFWLYGGLGNYPDSAFGVFNDLWKFSPGLVTAINNTPSSNPINTKIQLFNNPSNSNRFQFKSDQFYQKLQWQIIDEMGRILQEGSLHLVLKSSVQTVSTKALNKGIYFIRFLGDSKIQQTLTWIKE